jgi:hypothetical protein
MLDRLRELFRRTTPTEDDVAADQNVARTRATGGEDRDGADSGVTTGTGANEEFVGRVAGQDEGADGESGAEARAEAARHRTG